MKKIISLILVTAILISCGQKEDSVESLIESGDVSAMRAKKTELTKQQTDLRNKLDRLSREIEKYDKKREAALVTTQVLKDTLFKHYIEVQGSVQTDENIIIYPEYSGVLTRVFVKEGDRVRKGQQLAKIDDGGLSSQLARQEAQTALAKTTFERQKRLWDQQIGSEIQFLEAKTNYEASQAATAQLRSQLSKSIITAPFSGVIDDIIAEQGQVVTQGQSPVMRLVNLSDMYVRASIPENYLGQVNQGSDVIVYLSSLGKEFTGQIRQVGDFINPDNRTFDVRISLPNPESKIKPNLVATVKINDYTNPEAITIPDNIIQQNAEGENYVYIYEKETDSTGIARQTVIEKGFTYEKNVEIKSGLEEGARIIIEGARTLREGQEVRPTNPLNDRN